MEKQRDGPQPGIKGSDVLGVALWYPSMVAGRGCRIFDPIWRMVGTDRRYSELEWCLGIARGGVGWGLAPISSILLTRCSIWFILSIVLWKFRVVGGTYSTYFLYVSEGWCENFHHVRNHRMNLSNIYLSFSKRDMGSGALLDYPALVGICYFRWGYGWVGRDILMALRSPSEDVAVWMLMDVA